MTGIVFNLIVNLFMVALLMLTIAYCWVLNRRIKILQDSKSELAQLLRYFDESTQRASESIVALQTASKKIGETIQGRLEKANGMIDDLSFMIEKGNKVANQIEEGLSVQRARSRMVSSMPAPSPAAAPARIIQPPREAEAPEEIAQEPIPPARPTPVLTKERASAPLEAVLERMAERGKPAGNVTEMPAKSSARSRSEMELLAMLKSSMKV